MLGFFNLSTATRFVRTTQTARLRPTISLGGTPPARVFPLISGARKATGNSSRGIASESAKPSGTFDGKSQVRVRFVQYLGVAVVFGVALSWQLFPLAESPPLTLLDSSASRLVRAAADAENPEAEPVTETEWVKSSKLPREKAILTTAPDVPPPLERDYSAIVEVALTTSTKISQLTNQYKYEKWMFNGSVPGPFVRARVGDVVELSLTNRDATGNPHNIDSHAFTGPGGGTSLTTAEEGETKTGRFRLLFPGLYVYHCAAAPVPVHIANGMYGLIFVEPEKPLPPVDREYYVMQSEFYHEPPEADDDGKLSSQVEFSYPNALQEDPSIIVFNGKESATTTEKPLKAKVGETIRIYFGNAGPNCTSSFHVIGSHFKNLWRDGCVIDPPSQGVSTTTVPPGGSAIVDLKMVVPGTYTLVDHAIFRLDKGAVGYLNVSGKQQPEIHEGSHPPASCVGCKLHP